MKKAIIQGFTLIAIFCLSFFALSQIDWLNLFNTESISDKTEKKLGDALWKFTNETIKEDTNLLVFNNIDSIVNVICRKNEIDKKTIKLHIVRNDEVNAFALPNGHLIIYTGLIFEAENQDELSGVICHELAHIQLNHITKKIVKEIGLSAIISMTTGNTNSEMIKKTAERLSSSAFDRNLEKEADIKAVDFLVNAQINPEPFGNFLYRLSGNNEGNSEYLPWISSHPDSKERGLYIIEYGKDKLKHPTHILSEKSWHEIKKQLSDTSPIETQEQ